jgi:hypothetical protein
MTDAKTHESIRDEMPLLADNEGVWEGVYRHYDAASGKLLDQHLSRLICRITDDDRFAYYQTNFYFWPDGRTETREFPAWYENGRIWWDNDLIKGWAAAMRPDDHQRSTCLNWVRKGEPDVYLYEMIQNSADRRLRSRCWQWFRDDRCFKRTLIDEAFVTRDWKNWTNSAPPDLIL